LSHGEFFISLSRAATSRSRAAISRSRNSSSRCLYESESCSPGELAGSAMKVLPLAA
jgi:hypothetical protein